MIQSESCDLNRRMVMRLNSIPLITIGQNVTGASAHETS